MSDYLTTKELADLLRIKERKVYDLAASGKVPCSRATGKLLFPRAEIDQWLAENRTGPEIGQRRNLPAVFLGSHDPLLDWALRESRCGLATYFDGSLDGLDRFARLEGVATGLHVRDAETGAWNRPIVAARFSAAPVVLTGWCARRRGLILREGLEDTVRDIIDLRGRRVVPRQAEAGAQHLLLAMLETAGLKPGDVEMTEPERTEADAALAVRQGKADAALGLEAMAGQMGLPFVPLVTEEFDLLVDRRAWFEPAMQRFLDFCTGAPFRDKAGEFAGYDIERFGTIRFNGA